MKKELDHTPSRVFLSELKNMYWAEKNFAKLLKRAEKLASTRYLKASFKGHYSATLQHVLRLERIFSLLGYKNLSRKYVVAESLIFSGKEAIKATTKMSQARDLALIDTISAIEAFEIEAYQRLIRLAKDSGNIELVFLLEETLTEEQEAEETFAAVKEDTLADERFQTESIDMAVEKQAEQLEAV